MCIVPYLTHHVLYPATYCDAIQSSVTDLIPVMPCLTQGSALILYMTADQRLTCQNRWALMAARATFLFSVCMLHIWDLE